MAKKPRKEASSVDRPATPSGPPAQAALAYAIFAERQRTGRPGDHLSDWYEAERQLTAETA